MDRDEVIDIVEPAFIHDSARTASTFLTRLKDEPDLAQDIRPVFDELFCQAEADRRVTVVTAGVDAAFVDRSKVLT
jgi:hypothetical protein